MQYQLIFQYKSKIIAVGIPIMLEKTIWIIIKYFRGIIIFNKDTISSNINKYLETKDYFDNNSFSSYCICEKKVSMNITYLFKSFFFFIINF